ncbi:MAG TPA: hypothetical protein VGI81_07925 [Tepidisphaeraceae bacterium]|jgi:hypothetical protein
MTASITTKEAKPGFKARLKKEAKSMFLLFLYLALLLGSFTTYRRLLLAQYHITYLHYGYAVIEALVLAKVILIGRLLQIGSRRVSRPPLIWPTLYKTLCFGLLIVVFNALEYFVDGLWHRDTLRGIVADFFRLGEREILSRVIVMVVALVPLFAFWEADRALGEGKLLALFFRRVDVSMKESPAKIPASA